MRTESSNLLTDRRGWCILGTMGSVQSASAADRANPDPEAFSRAVVLIGSRLAGSAPAAVWLTAAGWAEAARRRFGSVVMVTPSGPIDPSTARQAATTPRPATGGTLRKRRLRVARDLAKDVRDLVRAAGFMIEAIRTVPTAEGTAFIWQHHEPWQWAGWLLARRCRAPWVLFVDAPVVWESRAWGVHRPGWGRFLERWGEVPQLRSADVVACVSETVATEVRRLGAPDARVIVTPCSADPSIFTVARETVSATRVELGLEDRIVVGWLGSFRRFHGIEILLDAYRAARREHPELALLLVGDGPERAAVEATVRAENILDVTFTGMVTHTDVPRYLTAVDIAVVIDPGATTWHYSPLKLREYMACGLAVVAPDSGQVGAVIRHGEQGLLVPPASSEALAGALAALARDSALRTRLGAAARRRSEADGGWLAQLEAALNVAEAVRRA